MPLNKFLPLLLCVIAAAGATVWGALRLAPATDIPLGLPVLIPVALLGYWVLHRFAGRGGTTRTTRR